MRETCTTNGEYIEIKRIAEVSSPWAMAINSPSNECSELTKTDIHKVVKFWRDSSGKDWRIFQKLKKGREYPQSLFFLHLCIEKRIKALIVKKVGEHAPYSHNLVLLMGKLDLSITEQMVNELTEISKFNIESRYPEEIRDLKKRIDLKKVQFWEKRGKTILQFLDQQF